MGTNISARLKRLERTSVAGVHRSTGCPVCDRVPEDRWGIAFKIDGIDEETGVPVCARCQRSQGNVFSVVQINGVDDRSRSLHGLASTRGG